MAGNYMVYLPDRRIVVVTDVSQRVANEQAASLAQRQNVLVLKATARYTPKLNVNCERL
jgi:hypothetical protein